jgi:hypothetical protein
MRILSIVSTIFLMHFATGVWSAVAIQCNPNLEVSWSFDQIENKSNFFETTDSLSSITLHLDTGFLKVPNAQNDGITLLRQQSIIKKSADGLDLTVKYESTNTMGVEKTNVILSDPMCKQSKDAVVSIFTAEEFSYINTIYNCDCVSPTHDIENFITN